VTLVDETTGEVISLASCETTIERGLKTFVDVGEALMAIRDGKLYLEAYDSFEDYCQKRWDLKRQRAYQLMAAADTATVMSQICDTPAPSVESHAQALTPLRDKPDAMAAAWIEVQEATGGRPTAADVTAAVDRQLHPTEEQADEPDEQAEPPARSSKAGRIVDMFLTREQALKDVKPADFTTDDLLNLQGLSSRLASFVGQVKAARRQEAQA
jgi:hypothetical protein